MKYYTSHVSKKLDIPQNTVRYWSKEYSIGTAEKQGKLTVRTFNDTDIEKFEKVKRLRKDNWSKQDILDQIPLREVKEGTKKVQKSDKEESEIVKELRDRIKSLESEKVKDREFFGSLIKSQQDLQGEIKELVRNQQIITKELQSILLLPQRATTESIEPTKPRQSKQQPKKKRRVTKRKKPTKKQGRKPRKKRRQTKKTKTSKNKQNILDRIVGWFS